MVASIQCINTPSTADVKLSTVEQLALQIPEYLTVQPLGATQPSSASYCSISTASALTYLKIPPFLLAW